MNLRGKTRIVALQIKKRSLDAKKRHNGVIKLTKKIDVMFQSKFAALFKYTIPLII